MTAIEWTDATWNPVRGCTRVSEGCRNCYAETMAARNLPEMRSPTTGKSFALRTAAGPRWTGAVELIPSKLEEPLRWRKPRRVFVNSMSDLLHRRLTDYDIAEVWARMAATPRHTYQLLTKRADRIPELLNDPDFRTEVERRLYVLDLPANGDSYPRFVETWPLPNVWLGVSIEDQATADMRIPLLLQAPAAKRFVSYEPALGPVDFEAWISDPMLSSSPDCRVPDHIPSLDWLIVGGESGPGARPFDVAWARATVEQCKAAGVAVFVKQLGAKPERECLDCDHGRVLGGTQECPTCRGCGVERLRLPNKKGGDPSEWAADLRVREFPA